MSNVLSDKKREQVLALGQLGSMAKETESPRHARMERERCTATMQTYA